MILDEIGRGTATFDGLAIAWATAEHLHVKNKSRALFATHYHEMTALCERLPRMTCVTMRVKEWNDSIVFLHEVTPGAADRSYGIHVAKLAGLPQAVVTRARRSAAGAGRRPRRPQAAGADRRPAAVRMPPRPRPRPDAVEEALQRRRTRCAVAQTGAGNPL